MTREAGEAAPLPGALAGEVRLAGIVARLDPSGALWWPAERTLVVSDLHLETGSSWARRRQMLPPYDSFVTLARLEAAVARHRPRRIVSLGDSFHDPFGVERLPAELAGRIAALAAEADLVWVTGNHEGRSVSALPGRTVDVLAVGPLTFRHEPSPALAEGAFEVAGHLHPAARVAARGRALRRRCFAGCERRLVMPAFGALTGGLNVTDAAFRALWPDLSAFRAFLMGRSAVFPVPSAALLPG